MLTYSNKNILLLISIFACLLGCTADVLLLYSPEGNYHLGDYQFFNGISKERMIPGYYLGILFIAFELLGFWVVSRAIYPKENKKNRLFFALVSYLFLLGIIYHAAVTFVGVFIKEVDDGLAIITEYQNLFRPLEMIMGSFLILVTFFIVSRILKGLTLFPKWIIFLNPVFVYAFIILLYFAIPLIGNFLIVAGFNLSNAVFLSACTYALWNKNLNDQL